MSYLDIYRQRVLANGEKSTDTIINASKETIRNNLNNSLFTETFLINGIEYSGLVTQGKTSDEKKLLFLPDAKIDIGSVVELKSKFYLIMDFLGEGINEIYPTATLRLTNSTFPIKANKTRVSLGFNDFGEEKFDYVDGQITQLPCIASFSTISDNVNDSINLPEGQILITIPFTVSDDIDEGKEFTMYGTKFQIVGVDYTKSINNVGLLVIKGKKV